MYCLDCLALGTMTRAKHKRLGAMVKTRNHFLGISMMSILNNWRRDRRSVRLHCERDAATTLHMTSERTFANEWRVTA